MDAKHSTIDDGSEDQEVENLTARLPDGCITVLLLALLVEAIDLGDLAGLMIAPNKCNPVWVSEKVSVRSDEEEKFTYLAFRHIRRVKVSRLK